MSKVDHREIPRDKAGDISRNCVDKYTVCDANEGPKECFFEGRPLRVAGADAEPAQLPAREVHPLPMAFTNNTLAFMRRIEMVTLESCACKAVDSAVATSRYVTNPAL